MEQFTSILCFVKELERLKTVTRTAWTATGRRESTAKSRFVREKKTQVETGDEVWT